LERSPKGGVKLVMHTVWSEGLFQPFLSDATLFVCKSSHLF
jgi:hypothetical protein